MKLVQDNLRIMDILVDLPKANSWDRVQSSLTIQTKSDKLATLDPASTLRKRS